MEEAANELRNADVEWAYVFDPNGRQLFRRRGTRETVFFASGEFAMLKDSIVLHNHPLGAGEIPEALTFSRADVAFAVRYDVAEMRLVCREWSFTLRRPADGWPVDDEIAGAVYDEIRADVDAALTRAVVRGQISASDRARRLAHETVNRLAAWGHFEYHREHR